MKTIWKFGLDPADTQPVQMPQNARILSAGVQDNDFVVWAAVDPRAPTVARRFAIHGTGHAVQDDTAEGAFINTVFIGPLVFHIFDLGEVVGGDDP